MVHGPLHGRLLEGGGGLRGIADPLQAPDRVVYSGLVEVLEVVGESALAAPAPPVQLRSGRSGPLGRGRCLGKRCFSCEEAAC